MVSKLKRPSPKLTPTTEDFVEIGYMSTIEVPVGIICACLPAIRSLFSVVFPQIFGSTSPRRRGAAAGGSSSSYYYYAGAGGSRSKDKSKSKSQRDSKVPCGGGGVLGNHSQDNNRSLKNKISVRQEWTVLSDPAPSDTNFQNNNSRNHSGSGSDSDVELVGVAVSTDVGGGADRFGATPFDNTTKSLVEVVSAARPETPWDETIGNVSGNNGIGSRFCATSAKG
ncbi:hypothetical protein SLS62_010772 [Diatrype stigma]|uniref:Rhodopsin domain-containing protein n=1 Tax=Diatrype stigma TaxID=117547 RepID=A0AAN9YHA1_9PEZI